MLIANTNKIRSSSKLAVMLCLSLVSIINAATHQISPIAEDAIFQKDLLAVNDKNKLGSEFGCFTPRFVRYGQSYNGEQQAYVIDETVLPKKENTLTIQSYRQEIGNGDIAIKSARLDTEKYWSTKDIGSHGYLEIKAHLPAKPEYSGRDKDFLGSWPAIWMLSKENVPLPYKVEIDITEMVHGRPESYQTLHSPKHYGDNGQHPKSDKCFCKTYHPVKIECDLVTTPATFGLEWNLNYDDPNKEVNLTWWIGYSEGDDYKIDRKSIKLSRSAQDKHLFHRAFKP